VYAFRKEEKEEKIIRLLELEVAKDYQHQQQEDYYEGRSNIYTRSAAAIQSKTGCHMHVSHVSELRFEKTAADIPCGCGQHGVCSVPLLVIG
jgi:hypothetical protein